MQSALPVTTLNCTQCGGELHPDEGQIFLTCPYCSATVYLDKSRVVFHWFLASTINETEARSSLARWMAGNQTVKDLDQKARLVSQSFQYYPVWYFKHRRAGRELIDLTPAAATSITELRSINLPAGDLRRYEPSLDSQAQEPTVPLEAAKEWLQRSLGAPADILESSLVHIPIYLFKYTYQNRIYTAVVEGGTGATLANIYPAKAEAPYLLAGGVTALVFLCLALIPIIGAAADRANGLGIGTAICAGLGLLAVPALLALALWVAAKV